MTKFNWFVIGLLVDLVGESIAYGVRSWRRKKKMRYFCVWCSYQTRKESKVFVEKCCFECKEFPTESAINSVIELKSIGSGFGLIKSLRINNIFEFKSEKDYLNFKS